MADNKFYVYAIMFDQDCFGIFASHEDAKQSLKQQIAAGGPAWDGCNIVKQTVSGTPEGLLSYKDLAERTWNAALVHAAEALDAYDVGQFDKIKVPSTQFDEWWEREVVSPPDTAWSAEEYGV